MVTGIRWGIKMAECVHVSENVIRDDLLQQISMPYDLDWDYFLETVIRGSITSGDGVKESCEALNTLEMAALSNTPRSVSNSDIDTLRKDIKYCVGQSENIDWNNLLKLTFNAKVVAERQGVNMVYASRTLDEIISDAKEATGE